MARVAGVSVATVSRVFNGNAPVRLDTRERIRAAAEALRYTPNMAARSMSTGRLRTLGVLLPDTHSSFYSEVLRGIGQVADERAFRLLLSGSLGTGAPVREIAHGMRGLVDGLIVMAPEMEPSQLPESLPDDVPAVLVNTRGTALDSVVTDDYRGARGMVAHLLQHGHAAVALVRGPASNYDAAERARGWRDALESHGLVAESGLEYGGAFTIESGYRAGLEILSAAVRPSAVFACNDTMAIGVLRALHEAGVRVPEEMAVAGFDDLPIARFMTPPLATVRVSIHELGRRACERLLSILDLETREVERVVVPAEVLPRTSCGCPCPAGEGSALVPELGVA